MDASIRPSDMFTVARRLDGKQRPDELHRPYVTRGLDERSTMFTWAGNGVQMARYAQLVGSSQEVDLLRFSDVRAWVANRRPAFAVLRQFFLQAPGSPSALWIYPNLYTHAHLTHHFNGGIVSVKSNSIGQEPMRFGQSIPLEVTDGLPLLGWIDTGDFMWAGIPGHRRASRIGLTRELRTTRRLDPTGITHEVTSVTCRLTIGPTTLAPEHQQLLESGTIPTMQGRLYREVSARGPTGSDYVLRPIVDVKAIVDREFDAVDVVALQASRYDVTRDGSIYNLTLTFSLDRLDGALVAVSAMVGNWPEFRRRQFEDGGGLYSWVERHL